MKNLGILSLLLFVFISADVFAQEADLKKAKKEGRKELKEHYLLLLKRILKLMFRYMHVV